MTTLMLAFASVGAFATGAVLGQGAYAQRRASLVKNEMRRALGAASILEASSVALECEGISARVISFAVRRSHELRASSSGKRPGSVAENTHFEELVIKAGLEGVLSAEGAARVRLELCVAGFLAGLLLGSPFSTELMIIGALIGVAWGFTALTRALKEEANCRTLVAERQLSQMIEVVVLGLKSGMSFDRALSLYHQRFDGSLSAAMASAQSQWGHGLVERSEGLRWVARSYESPLFGRLTENVIRSLRFGTSLADNLAVLAVEARAVRKAKLEERVAKAPVKMLMPVGGLILPAMLILIMGPILLELMQGF